MRFLSLVYEQKKPTCKARFIYQYNLFSLQLASELYIKHLNLKMSLLITAVYTVYIYEAICTNAFRLMQQSFLFHFSTSGTLCSSSLYTGFCSGNCFIHFSGRSALREADGSTYKVKYGNCLCVA